MNLNVRVALNMNNMSVPNKINKGQKAVLDLTANPAVFTSPGQVITNLNNKTNKLLAAWTNAQDGGKALKALMRDAEREFDQAMVDVGRYVEGLANGNESVIHLAGLDVRRHGNARQAFFGIKNMEPGKVLLSVLQQGVAYIWQYSTDPSNAASWVEAVVGTRKKLVVEGLQPGVRYWFRCAVIDKTGKHPFSEPVSAFVA